MIEESDAELLFKNRCRLYFQKTEDKSWADRGMGTLTLRRPKAGGGGGGAYIVFTMESGRCADHADWKCRSHRLDVPITQTLHTIHSSGHCRLELPIKLC